MQERSTPLRQHCDLAACPSVLSISLNTFAVLAWYILLGIWEGAHGRASIGQLCTSLPILSPHDDVRKPVRLGTAPETLWHRSSVCKFTCTQRWDDVMIRLCPALALWTMVCFLGLSSNTSKAILSQFRYPVTLPLVQFGYAKCSAYRSEGVSSKLDIGQSTLTPLSVGNAPRLRRAARRR